MSDYFYHSDWLNKRLGKFTSSEIHKLFVSGKGGKFFGDGAETYIRQKVAEEITQTTKEEVNSKSIEHGYAHELDAIQAFEKATGFTGITYGIGNPQFFEYGDHAGGSPDWEEVEVRGADVKSPYNSDIHLENLFIENQEQFKKQRWEYYCQAQMNMKLRNWKEFYFVSYDPRMPSILKLAILKITPDKEWVTEFEERLSKAIERKDELMEKLLNKPSILLATRDNQNNLTVINAA